MSSFQISATLAFLFFALSVFADDVVVLTEDNFEKEVGQDRGALVEFYAPWYYHLFSVLYLCSLPFSETLRINLYHMGNHILIHYLNELNLRHWSCFYFDRCLSWKLAPRLISCVEISVDLTVVSFVLQLIYSFRSCCWIFGSVSLQFWVCKYV